MPHWPPSAVAIPPFHDQEETVGSGHGLVQGLFGGFSGGGHQGLLVVEGNGVEDERVDIGLDGPDRRFGAARAFRVVQPDDRGAASGGQGVSHLGDEGRAQAHGRGHGGAEFHELTAGDAACFKPFSASSLPRPTEKCIHVLLCLAKGREMTSGSYPGAGLPVAGPSGRARAPSCRMPGDGGRDRDGLLNTSIF